MANHKLYFILFILILFCAFSVSGFNLTHFPVDPSLLLTGGNNVIDGSGEYDTITNITTGLGDGLLTTQYSTYYSSSPVPYQYLIEGWAFNCYNFDSTLFSFTSSHDGSISGDLDSIQFPDTYYGGYFDGTDYVTVSDNDDFDIPDLDNFTMCSAFNTTLTSGIQNGIINKRITGDGFSMIYMADETVDCIFDGDTGTDTVSSGVVLNDDELHIICCRKWNDSIDMWVDGVMTDSDSGDYGIISNDFDLFIGSKNNGANQYEGTIKQVGLFSTRLDDSLMLSFNETKSIANMSNAQAIQVFFNNTIDFNISDDYFILINNTALSISTIRVMSYLNMTHPDYSNYITDTISSGEIFFNINDIIYDGYNYPFRIWGIQGRQDINISDIYLYENLNDTINPSITNCSVNTSSISCGETVRMQCQISDNQAVYKTYFTVNITSIPLVARQEANKYDGIYYLDKTYTAQYPDPIIINWFQVNATDLFGNTNITNLDLNITYTCCAENWVASWTNSSCMINDTFSAYVEYEDINSCNTTFYLPEDNGTITYHACNYCSEDLEQVSSLCTYQNGTYIRNTTWKDNLYSYCCAITGLVSDCSVDYSPYNQTSIEFCTIFNNTMDCDSNTHTEYAFFGDKTRWICYPPVSPNSSTNCMSYVQDPSSGVIQTNPNYITKTESIISFDNEYEDRTSFEAVGNMVSVYFTKDNLLFDGREYVFGVRCTNNGNFYTYEQLIIPEYENVNYPITRLFWLKGNIVPLFLALFMGAVIITFIAIAISKLSKGWHMR